MKSKPSTTTIKMIERRLKEISVERKSLKALQGDVLILHDALQDVVYALKEIRGDR
jgi:hypothetical protein